MKRIIGGSFLAGFMTVFLLLGVSDLPLLTAVVFAIFWYGLSVSLLISGLKAVKHARS